MNFKELETVFSDQKSVPQPSPQTPDLNTASPAPSSIHSFPDAQTTPMLKQYQEIKAKHPHSILFFRLGDFYEMFNDDAKAAANILDLVLTSRSNGKSAKVPMCGVPYHAADNYIAKLIKAGLKVSICEQVEDPALAQGIVKRDVIRTITSGTFLDDATVESRYLLSVSRQGQDFGVALMESTSGTLQTNQFKGAQKVIELLTKLPVYECVFPESQEEFIADLLKHPAVRLKNIILSPFDDWCFNPELARKALCDHFHLHNLSGFGIDELNLAQANCGALLEYLKRLSKQPLQHLDKISLYTDEHFVYISPAAGYGLELEDLLKTLDQTLTSAGKRKFRTWLYHPLKNIPQIEERQKAITLLRSNTSVCQELEKLLRHFPDIEKSVSRLSCGYHSPKDILWIRNSLVKLPEFQRIVTPLSSQNSLFKIEDIADLRELLEKAVNPDLPLSHYEGKVIRPGYNPQIDELRDIQKNGQEWLKNLQTCEIKRTGINSLKIGFNSVFGYYIEITKANAHLVPQDYIRKQTLVNGERYITPELKEFEEKILSAEEKIFKLENKILEQLRMEILNRSLAIHQFAASVATLDCLYSLSLLSLSPNYILPKITQDTTIDIKDGRHPVVEKASHEAFIANDTLLDCDEQHLIILTGPNMAGKSTYIRQTAVLVILGQMGSFIPARSAAIGLVDKIFTRIGAHDDISKGQSTFMVEMNETADILNNISPRSLVILDEIGRGTSTYDGLSLAWALAEHLQKLKVRTLFATHFHELTALADSNPGIKNYNVAVKEWKDEIVFLHKIIPGSTDDSYGIYVAKLAGIPKEVIQRSKQILTELELKNNLKDKIRFNPSGESQLSLFGGKADPALEEIKTAIEELDVNSLTPIQALNKLQELKELLDGK